MIARLKIWLLGGECVQTDDEDEQIVLLRFHRYGALEKLWQRIRRSEDA